MKILNLFAGIGGNRALWGDKHDITAVEYDEKIAKIYREKFPKDEIIIGDAYQYFLDNFEMYKIVWASPPCQSHTGLTNMNVGNRYNKRNVKLRLPDMRLYGLIFFLKHHFRGNWIVENVKTFYKPLVKPTCIRGRHYYWSNISLPSKNRISLPIEMGTIDYNRHPTKIRNKVDKNEGLLLLQYLLGKKQMKLF